jgi:hypothetical protein
VLQKLPPHSLPPNKQTETLIKRFLHDTHGNVDDAVANIQKHLSWRKKIFPIRKSSMLNDSFNKAHAFLPLGKAKDGSYILLIRSGYIPINTMDLNNVVKLVVSTVEHILAHDKGPGLPKFTILYDRTDFSIRENFKKEFYKRLINVFTDNYPQFLKAIYVHPTDWVLNTLWKIIKNFMKPETAKKVKMVSKAHDLQTYIDVENIPTWLGGTQTIDHLSMDSFFKHEPKQIKDRFL